MPVFKVYFHVLRKCLPSILIYLTVFVVIAIVATNMYKPSEATDFQSTKANIAVINRDEDSDLIRGLKEYLAKGNTLVELPDDTERMQDEIFYRNVDYIAMIPAGFTSDFEADGKNTQTIEKVIVPDSTTARYVDMQIQKYLNTARYYAKFSAMPTADRSKAVIRDLSNETPVTVNSFNSKTLDDSSFNFIYYFNYFAYIIIAIILLGISTILMVFNKPDLRRRNLCSPVHQRSMNLQLALGSAIFAVFCWLLLIIIGIILYGQEMLSSGLIPLCLLNSFVFTIVSVSIGFLVGSVIKSYSAQSAVANVVCLGMSFLCGVFVPQSIMSKTVLHFSSFLPAYWYVKANNTISKLTDFTVSSLSPLFVAILIQLGFAVAIFSVALLINKQKRTKA